MSTLRLAASNRTFRDRKTKNRKTFTTDFFRVGDEIRQIVEDWVNYLYLVKLWVFFSGRRAFSAKDLVSNGTAQYVAGDVPD